MERLKMLVIKPLLARVGTAFAAWMIAQGFDATLVDQAATGLVAVLLIAGDLVIGRAINDEGRR